MEEKKQKGEIAKMKPGSPKSFIIKILSSLPAILVACMIFGFSGQNAEQSSGLSGKAANYIIELTNGLQITEVSTFEHEQMVERLQLPIRKAAHMTEYLIFALTIAFALHAWGQTGFKLYQNSWILAAAFACTDEFHQLFVGGRSARFTDVIIDSTGAFIGLLLLWFIAGAVRNRKNRINS